MTNSTNLSHDASPLLNGASAQELEERKKADEEYRRNKLEYKQFLRTCGFIKVNTQWRKVQDRLEDDDTFLSLDKLERFELFQFIYLICRPNGSMQLSHFITIYESGVLLLSQLPSFHSLRHINLMSLIMCFGYSTFVMVASIYIGESNHAPKNYSVIVRGVDRVFSIFTAIFIMASQFGNGIFPEIQATLAPPVAGKIFKALAVCYSVVVSSFYCVGITGYWAFGNLSKGTVLHNIMVDSKSLTPEWLLFVINIIILAQVLATSVTYLQPTNLILENKFADPKKGQYSARNILPQIFFRSLSVVGAAVVAAMLPFFVVANGY